MHLKLSFFYERHRIGRHDVKCGNTGSNKSFDFRLNPICIVVVL